MKISGMTNKIEKNGKNALKNLYASKLKKVFSRG